MELLNLQQGSDEWLAVRLSHFTASEAPIMMGASPHMSRDDLLTYKTTQIQEEVDCFTQKIYDKGHELEALARPLAETIIGTELYPVTGRDDIEGMPLLASFDGLDMMEQQGFEHKQWNESKAISIAESGELFPEYYWQLEHQLLVSGADYILFVMSDGTEDNFVSLKYQSDPDRRKQLIAGWNQFQKDLVGYVPAEYIPAPEGKAPRELPALSIQLVGQVTGSNLEIYKETALSFIESINTDLKTDQDFADADKTIKFCGAAEKEIEVVKKQALSKTADIDLLFRTVDELKEAMRSKRLELNKLVESRKKAIRNEVVMNANNALKAHIDDINAKLKIVLLPPISADFNQAIKGKKTIKSLQESANDELAAAKIRANEFETLMSANLKIIDEQADEYRFLFNDLPVIILKAADDFQLLVKSRVADHKKAEEEKLEAERQRIREEEEAKANAKTETVAEPQKPVRQSGVLQTSSTQTTTQDNPDPSSNEEKEIVNYLYSHFGLYGETSRAVAIALMDGRVPYMKFEGQAAKAA